MPPWVVTGIAGAILTEQTGGRQVWRKGGYLETKWVSNKKVSEVKSKRMTRLSGGYPDSRDTEKANTLKL